MPLVRQEVFSFLSYRACCRDDHLISYHNHNNDDNNDDNKCEYIVDHCNAANEKQGAAPLPKVCFDPRSSLLQKYMHSVRAPGE